MFQRTGYRKTTVLRFHLDEHVDHAIADGLRTAGINVTTSTDAGLLGASDEEQLEYGLRETRSIYTNDDDFLAMTARGRSHAGVFYSAVGARSIGYLVNALSFFSDELDPADMANRIEYL